MHSLTPHDTSLTIIPLNESSIINHQSTQFSHYILLPYRSHGKTGPFDAFPTIDRFSAATLQPVESVQRMRASNPEVLALKVLIANLAVLDDFGVDTVMELKEALTVCLFDAIQHFFAAEIASKKFTFFTPREKSKRGATICFCIHGVDAKALEEALLVDKYQLGHRFEVDVRPGATKGDPDTFRVTAHYAHMGFADAANLAFCLHKCYLGEVAEYL
jgi:selenocysteine lyase/cysteine desulfurase